MAQRNRGGYGPVSLAVAISVAAPMLAACAGGGSDQKSAALTPEQVLKTCGIFRNAQSTRELDFTFPDAVEFTQLTPAAETAKEDVLGSKNVIVSKGHFSIDDATSTIMVNIGGVQTTYSAYSPAGITGCILLSGPADAADLTKSWFADLDTSDADDEPEHGP